ncbi:MULTISPECIES: thioesterase family protein [unclassified Rhodococcus (in: high G+C Gram-positive bacteria)]|uniref:acyl-CoA thioesterase n=1 Tax=Rhodococcus sp. SJ-3 TaxID=3454628 RepID=UPI003F79E4A0
MTERSVPGDSVEPYRAQIEVRWADSDRLGHVNNTKVVEYMQEGRIKFLQSGELRRGAIAVRKMDVEFLRPIKDESGPLTIEIIALHVGNTSYTLRHTVLDRNGGVCARGDAVLVGFDQATERPRPITDGEREVLARHRVVATS